MTLHNLGEVALLQNRFDKAAELYGQGVELSRSTGDRYSQAWSLIGLGKARKALGDLAAAVASWRRAHALLVAIDPDAATRVVELLGEHRPPGPDSAAVQ